MKIGIYNRVSTEKQASQGVSLRDQKQRGIEFCKKENYEYEIFQDSGLSGSLKPQERPGLNSLLEKIYLDEIQGIFVVDWDRLSRDQSEGFALMATLQENNIRVFSTSGEIQFNDPNHQLLTSIKILMSSYETKRLQARIKRNLERNIIDGKVSGGALQPFGYRKGENKELLVDEDEAEVVKLIFSLCIEGLGTKRIANKLNELEIPTKRMRVEAGRKMKVRGEVKLNFKWRDSVIYGILKNTIYKGQRLYRGKYYNSPSIISEDKFDLAQEIIENRNHFKDTNNKYFYLLKGLTFCLRCDNRYYGRKREDLSDNAYICSSQRYSGEFCGNRGINIDKLNNYVWNSVLTLPLDIRKSVNDFNDKDGHDSIQKIAAKEKQIVDLHEKVNRLLSLYESGKEMDESFIKPRIDKLYNEISDEKEKLRLLKKTSNLLNSKEEIIDYLESQLSSFNKKQIGEKDKQEIIRSLVKFVGILWHKKLKKHFIWIEFKLDRFTQLRLGKQVYYENKNFNWTFEDDEENTQFLFRRINATIINPKKVNLEKDFFAIRINDKGYMENNPFKQ